MINPVQFDNTTLCELARHMGEAEKCRDPEFLQALLAETLTFRHASGAVMDKAMFLQLKSCLTPFIPLSVYLTPIYLAFILLAGALALSTSAAATGLIETAAHCQDGSSIQSNQGSSPRAACMRGVSEFGPPYRIGATNTEALVTSSLRDKGYKQGVSAAAHTILNTDGPDKLFGARAYVSLLDGDWFSVTAVDINDVAIPGGRLVVNLRLRGSLLLSGNTGLSNSFSRLSYAVVLENEAGGLSRAEGDLRLEIPGVQAVSQEITIPAPWIAEGRIDFAMTMIAEVQAMVDQTGSAHGASSFASSLEWLGIDQVTDESGVPVASFLAMNPETGVNWGVPSPVPDPAVWVLLGAGLPLLALRCRQRRPERRSRGLAITHFNKRKETRGQVLPFAHTRLARIFHRPS